MSAIPLLVLSACGGIVEDESFGTSSAELKGRGHDHDRGHGRGHGHDHDRGHGRGHGHDHDRGHGHDHDRDRHGEVKRGERLFETAFRGTNGRSCATCHVPGDHFVLKPEHVQALLAENPNDPLFNRLDADDPLAPEPTYEHLKKGLVRVILTLPDNMDVIDFEGNVITRPDRTIEVWRAVPTVENVAITAPFQYDGRAETLQDQAQGAITAHSEGGQVAKKDLDAIAAFQEAQFTSDRARSVAKKVARGVPLEDIERPELTTELTPAQARGLEIYNMACEPCHGGGGTPP
ncbi:MAG: cytochrome c peroxidase, partial [Pseudomonadota bacterium]